MTERCPLCGGDTHPSPDTKQDRFGLICPGTDAPQDVQDLYVRLLADNYLTQLTDEAQAYVDEIERRKQEWAKRERSSVTHEELQADCDVGVAKLRYLHSEKQPGAITDTPDLDIDPPHLTVAGVVPPRRTTVKVTRSQDKTQDDDVLLFLETKEEPDGG